MGEGSFCTGLSSAGVSRASSSISVSSEASKESRVGAPPVGCGGRGAVGDSGEAERGDDVVVVLRGSRSTAAPVSSGFCKSRSRSSVVCCSAAESPEGGEVVGFSTSLD